MSFEVLDPAMYPDGPGQRFEPNSWAQQRFLDSNAPDLLYSGRLGSSKTRTLCEKADERCRLFPGSRVVVARRYREHIGNTTLVTLRDETVSRSHWQWGWRRSEEGGSTLHYPNGSSIMIIGLDNPQRLLSAEVDLILVDQCEEMTENQWDAAASRLRYRVCDADGLQACLQMAGACNPDGPSHFLYRRFRPDMGSHVILSHEAIELPSGTVVPAGDLVSEVVCAAPLDNMDNLDARYQARLARFSGRWYERMVLGKWTAFEGQVFDIFDQSMHVVQRPAAWDAWGGFPPPSWERVRGIDFGYYPDPFVCVWLARSPLGVWYVYRQHYLTRTLVTKHAELILREEERELSALNVACVRYGIAESRHLNVIGSFADHDAEDRATLVSCDVAAERARKDVTPGIQTVYELLAAQKLLIVRDGLIQVDADRAEKGLPLRLEDELGLYRWQRQPDDVDKPSRDQPVDQHNHAIDAVRYAIHTLRARSGWL